MNLLIASRATWIEIEQKVLILMPLKKNRSKKLKLTKRRKENSGEILNIEDILLLLRYCKEIHY